jgi:dihydrofolate reductase|tara:strand:+ start:120 stop:668 length:549 start_codon:yes stop_codon:yes gene_type:complete
MKIQNNIKAPIICIVAMNEKRIIGDGQKLLWHIPGDLKRLKSMTMGAPLIMGRKTWDSIGFPLPGRASVVLTNSKNWEAKGAIKASSFDDAIIKSNQWLLENENSNEIKIKKKIFLFGGAQIYKLGIQYCDTIEITKVLYDVKHGPQFPFLNDIDWKKKKLEQYNKTSESPEYSYWRYNRIK